MSHIMQKFSATLLSDFQSFRRGYNRFPSSESSSYLAGRSSRESSIVPSYRYTPKTGIYGGSRWQSSRENSVTSR